MKHYSAKMFKTLVLTILLISPIFSFGQLVSNIAAIDSAKTKPAAIPIVNIVQKIEEANRDIKDTNRRIRLKKNILLVDSLFPSYAKFLEVQRENKEKFVAAGPNREKINNLVKKWTSYEDNLEGWKKVVNDYVTRNTILLEGVVLNEKTWELTYQKAKEEKVPLEVLSSIKVVWNNYQNMNSQLVTENNRFLLLETKINKEKSSVIKIIEDLTDLKNSEIYNLSYLRHQPLWKTSFSSDKKTEDENDKAESISENVSGIFSFMKSSENSISLFILTVIVLTFLLRMVKGSFEQYPFNEQDMDLQHAKDIILRHNIECIVFLSLVAAKLFFPNAPMLFGNILIFIALIVAIPMIQPYMYKRFKKIIYFVVLFYVLDTAKTYIWFSPAQYRIYLLLEALFVVLVLFAFTHPYLETRKMKIGRFGLLLIRLTPVVYGLLITSIISNILGYTNLTDLTLKIGTQSGVFTLIFYGILMSAEGVVTGLIHRIFNLQESFDPDYKLRLGLKSLQIIRVGAFILWLLFFLKMVDLLSPFTEFLSDVLVEPYIIGSITFTLGDVLLFVLILSVSFLLTSLISFLFDSGEVSVSFIKLPKGIPAAISLVIRYFIIAFGIVLALSSLGIDLSKFNLMAGALGLGIGFGLQTVVSNFISGLILVFERPIHIGDTVEVNNLLGTVNRIGVRSSSISTFDGAEVIVPNNNLIANDLINWTLSDSIKRIEILVGTTYGSDPNKVLEILLDVVSRNKDALKNPAPHALFSEFGESSLNFKLRYWVNYEIGLQSKSDISIGIYNQFAEHGIEIPFPQTDVHIKNMPGMTAPEKSLSNPGVKGPGKKPVAVRKVKKPVKKDSASAGEDIDQTK